MENLKKFAFILGLMLLTFYFIGCGSKQMKKAKEFVEVGMYEEAIPLLEMEVKEHPKNSEAHFLLGKAYLYTDQMHSARNSFERAVITNAKLRGKITEEYRGCGLALLKEGILSQAEEMFDQAVNFDADARGVIAEELIQHGKEIAERNIEMSHWCFKEALDYSKDYKDNIGIECLNLADNFLDQDKVDESIFFAELAKEVLGEEFEKKGENYILKLQEIVPPIKTIGHIEPPKLIKRVWPVYPKIAREGRIGGGVTLEVTTDIRGKVKDLKVIRSVPLLDHAAIYAVRQWEYETKLVNGLPRAITFKEVVPFVMLYLKRDGTMYVNQSQVMEENLGAMLDEAFSNAGIKAFNVEERKLYLRADQDLQFGKIIDIIDIMKNAAIEEVGIIADKKPEKILDIKIHVRTSADISKIPWDNGKLTAPFDIPEEIQNYFILTLTKYVNTLFINQERIEFNSLNSRLKSIYKTHQNIPVFIRADAGVHFRHIIELIDIVKEAGFDTIGIIPEYFRE
ncbi:MAG: hypothetical protein DRJ11_12185 [Candidatus Aminicenantes bacterium]|nr:MAG: hypothetical protein DRJ11_12185 [Candidatus Aminicenantes bacterium]